ncbi:hypothetical protein HYT45_02885 [Candidatus Uhrbacteria bacterium]|nr:hypothetical protein [Candidatus Uhrbacteria bacterium]
MFNNIKADVKEISSYLWIVVIAATFSIFALKYDPNPTYLYVGFITFTYGLIGHIIFRTFDEINLKGGKRIFVRIILEVVTVGTWLFFIIK